MELPYTNMGRSIMAIDKLFKHYFKSALGAYDLNASEGMVLLVLFGSDAQTAEDILEKGHQPRLGRSQDQILDQLHYDKAAMTRSMQALEKKGFVLRGDNPADNRSYLFCLTEKAKQFRPKLFAILRHWNDGVLQGLDEQGIALMTEGLGCMLHNAAALSRQWNDAREEERGVQA